MQIGGSLGQGLLCSLQTIEIFNAPRAPNQVPRASDRAQSKQMKRARLTPGTLDQVPRASDLGPLVLGWWIHWEGVLFRTTLKVNGSLIRQ